MQPLSPQALAVFRVLTEGLSQVGDHRKISNNQCFMPVSVEVVGTTPQNALIVSVAHYYEQNGDLMADPEVTFVIARITALPDHVPPGQPRHELRVRSLGRCGSLLEPAHAKRTGRVLRSVDAQHHGSAVRRQTALETATGMNRTPRAPRLRSGCARPPRPFHGVDLGNPARRDQEGARISLWRLTANAALGPCQACRRVSVDAGGSDALCGTNSPTSCASAGSLPPVMSLVRFVLADRLRPGCFPAIPSSRRPVL